MVNLQGTGPKRLLIVTSTWQPAMIADMQRARMMCRHLREFGWEPEVLAPDLSHQPPQCIEAEAGRFFDAATPWHAAAPRAARLWDMAGSSTIALRAFAPVLLTGDKLLATGRFDLVFFTTAHYLLDAAGCWWRRRHSVPFVVDTHDPWYAGPVRPKRGLREWKAAAGDRLGAASEQFILSRAAGVVSVSPAYLSVLSSHYGAATFPWQRAGRSLVEPFATDAPIGSRETKEPAANPDEPATIAYCGAGGRVMAMAWRHLCRALQTMPGGPPQGVRFLLRGTSLHHRPGDPHELQETARALGCGEVVDEDPARLSYADSMKLAEDAAGVLLLGVNDPGYMASKLFLYLATGRPLLAVVKKGSIMLPFLRESSGVWLLEFGDDETVTESEAGMLRDYIDAVRAGARYDRSAALAPRTAREMTRRLAAFFDRCTAEAARDR